MWAESDGEGKGATFFVKLPLSDVVLPRPSLTINCDSPYASHEDDMHVQSLKLSDTSLRPLVILVVDDSTFTRRLTIQLLKQICGDTRVCTFLEAVDGQEAVSYVMQSMEAPTLTTSFQHSRVSSVSRRPSITSKLSGRNSNGRVSPVASAFNSGQNTGCNSKLVSARASASSSAINTPTIFSSRSSTAAGMFHVPSFDGRHVLRHVAMSNTNSATPSRRSSKSDFDNLLQRSLLDLNISGKSAKSVKSEVDSGAVSGLVSVGSSGSSGTGSGGGGGGGVVVVDVGVGGGGPVGGGSDCPHRRGSVNTRITTTTEIDVVFMDYNMPRMVRVPPCYPR